MDPQSASIVSASCPFTEELFGAHGHARWNLAWRTERLRVEWVRAWGGGTVRKTDTFSQNKVSSGGNRAGRDTRATLSVYTGERVVVSATLQVDPLVCERYASRTKYKRHTNNEWLRHSMRVLGASLLFVPGDSPERAPRDLACVLEVEDGCGGLSVSFDDAVVTVVCKTRFARVGAFLHIQRLASHVAGLSSRRVRVVNRRCWSEDTSVAAPGDLDVEVASEVMLSIDRQGAHAVFQENPTPLSSPQSKAPNTDPFVVVPLAHDPSLPTGFSESDTPHAPRDFVEPHTGVHRKKTPVSTWSDTKFSAPSQKTPLLAVMGRVVFQDDRSRGCTSQRAWLVVRNNGSAVLRWNTDVSLHALSGVCEDGLKWAEDARALLKPARVRTTNVFSRETWRNGLHLGTTNIKWLREWFEQPRCAEEGVRITPPKDKCVSINIPQPAPPFLVGLSRASRTLESVVTATKVAFDAFERELTRLQRTLHNHATCRVKNGWFTDASLSDWVARETSHAVVREVTLHGVTFQYIPEADAPVGISRAHHRGRGGELENTVESGFSFPRFIVAVSFDRWVFSLHKYPRMVDKLQDVYHAALHYQRLLQLDRITRGKVGLTELHIRSRVNKSLSAVVFLDEHGNISATRCVGILSETAVRWAAAEVRACMRLALGASMPTMTPDKDLHIKAASITPKKTVQRTLMCALQRKLQPCPPNIQTEGAELSSLLFHPSLPKQVLLDSQTLSVDTDTCELLRPRDVVWDDYVFRASFGCPKKCSTVKKNSARHNSHDEGIETWTDAIMRHFSTTQISSSPVEIGVTLW
jgi:hypothetical protein